MIPHCNAQNVPWANIPMHCFQTAYIKGIASQAIMRIFEQEPARNAMKPAIPVQTQNHATAAPLENYGIIGNAPILAVLVFLN